MLNYGIIYRGMVPTGEEGRTVVVLDALYPDEVNRGIIMGIVPCAVNVLDLSHRFARPIAGNPLMLESSVAYHVAFMLQSKNVRNESYQTDETVQHDGLGA